jgi:hypothetical protein
MNSRRAGAITTFDMGYLNKHLLSDGKKIYRYCLHVCDLHGYVYPRIAPNPLTHASHTALPRMVLCHVRAGATGTTRAPSPSCWTGSSTTDGETYMFMRSVMQDVGFHVLIILVHIYMCMYVTHVCIYVWFGFSFMQRKVFLDKYTDVSIDSPFECILHILGIQYLITRTYSCVTPLSSSGGSRENSVRGAAAVEAPDHPLRRQQHHVQW